MGESKFVNDKIAELEKELELLKSTPSEEEYFRKRISQPNLPLSKSGKSSKKGRQTFLCAG